MNKTTGISWTDHTWNPWQGCKMVSAGCAQCYMFRDMRRYGKDPENVRRSADATFRKPLKLKEPAKVFTCSWSDFFIVDADPWRADAWAIIKATPHLTYQILTKRPDRIANHLPPDWGDGYANVWLGVSVENQEATARIPVLQKIPAAVRFLSVEPLLGFVNLCCGKLDGIGWAIFGGESGANPREMPMDAFGFALSQCRAAGVPVWVKQDSGTQPGLRGRIPPELFIQEFPR